MTGLFRDRSRILRIALVLCAAVFAVTGMVALQSYRSDQRHNIQTVVSAAELTLDSELENVDDAAVRISSGHRLIALLKEADPFNTVVALNRQLREEKLDFGYLLSWKDGSRSQWLEGASLGVFDRVEDREDSSEIRLLRSLKQKFRIGGESSVAEPSGLQSSYVCHEGGLYAVARRDVMIWDSPAATLLVGRRLSQDERVVQRLRRILGNSGDEGTALGVFCGGELALTNGIGSSNTADLLRRGARVQSRGGLEFGVLEGPRALTRALQRAAITLWIFMVLGGAVIWQVLRESRRKENHARAALLALMRQMSPHFLFNALNTISAVLHSDVPKARSLLQDLAAIYRQIVDSTKRELIPLSEEMRIVESYLRIQSARFEERLRWSIQAEGDSWRGMPVPPLLIQTLVENAVKHGISDAVEGGEIRVAIEPDPTGFRVSVLNTGEPLNPNYREGVGLRNSRARLSVMSGVVADSNFQLRTREDGWTEASFVLRGAQPGVHQGGLS